MNKKTKSRRRSTAFEPTRQQRKTVESMTAFGVPQDQICIIIEITKPTLHKHFRKEIDTGLAKANAAVAQNLFKKATSNGPSCTAEIFWLKTRAGWKEPPAEHKHTGAIGSYDLSKLDDASLAKLEAILGQAAIIGADPSRESET